MTNDERDFYNPAVTISRLRELNELFYWACFRAEIGSRAHAFIEFNGLMSKYVDLLERAVAQGVDPVSLNEHCGVAVPVETHDMAYLAEKLRCIFGPFIDGNPEAREVLRAKLFGEPR
jgi:hypothetical protein